MMARYDLEGVGSKELTSDCNAKINDKIFSLEDKQNPAYFNALIFLLIVLLKSTKIKQDTEPQCIV